MDCGEGQALEELVEGVMLVVSENEVTIDSGTSAMIGDTEGGEMPRTFTR